MAKAKTALKSSVVKKIKEAKSQQNGSMKLDCQKLKKAMTLKKLSIAEIAHKSNGALFYTQVDKIFSGKTHPRPKTVRAICKVLGVSEKAAVKV